MLPFMFRSRQILSLMFRSRKSQPVTNLKSKLHSNSINASIGAKTNPNMASVNWQEAVKDLDPRQVEFYHNEKLIMVDANDNVFGPISKGEGHSIETVKKSIYHRALSLLIFDSSKRFLLTQRSSSKITFPEYYTNACCSHPLFMEQEIEDDGNAIGVRRAVIRRSGFELGTKLGDIHYNELKLVNKLCYRAESDGGQWGEAEIDYIFILHKDIELNPNEDEVKSYLYVTRQEMHDLLINQKDRDKKITPWVRLLARDYLFKYWDNLHQLDKIAEPKKIIRYEEIFPAV